MAESTIDLTFLRDRGQTPEQIAAMVTAFCAAATTSLDIAVYDCGFQGALAQTVADTINGTAQRGVAVRFGYFAGPHLPQHGVPPPSGSTDAFVAMLQVPTRGITGFQDLMHHKYMIRDANSPGATVWTGSTNWTSDAWSREENAILILPSADLARCYTVDFEQLWETGKLEHSGRGAAGRADLQYDSTAAPVQVWFSPADGEDMAAEVASAVQGARQRIVVASPVITDGPILGALRDIATAGSIEISGIYDATQMAEVKHQWGDEERTSWKVDAFGALVGHGGFAGKRSTPYGPHTVHDFMHVKLLVVDDMAFAGSYNLSRSGETNAENLLLIDNADFAQACVSYIQTLIAHYAPDTPAW